MHSVVYYNVIVDLVQIIALFSQKGAREYTIIYMRASRSSSSFSIRCNSSLGKSTGNPQASGAVPIPRTAGMGFPTGTPLGRSPSSRCRQGEGEGASVLIVLSSLRHCVVAGREGKGKGDGEGENEGVSSSSSRGSGSGRGCIVVRKRVTARTRRRRWRG